MSLSPTTKMVMFLPTELVTDIFLRLPAKSILRFRGVCRDWRNVIDSKNFTKMHLNKNKINCCLIVQGSGEPCLYSLGLNSLEETVKLDVRSWWPDDRWLNLFGVQLWGSCNGLLCLSSFWTDIALWNPSTKKYLLLPRLSFGDDLNFSGALGFGYDSATDDYKVVSILQRYTDTMILINTEVNVFSLRSKSWRRVYNGFPKEIYRESLGMLVRNSLHWLLTPKYNEISGSSIVAFDLTTEEVKVFSFTSSMKGWGVGELSLQIIKERVAVSLFLKNEGFELWVMEEYGVKESWTKLISIGEESLTDYIWPIRCCRNKGMLVLTQSNDFPSKVVWYDFQTKEIEEIPIRGLPGGVYRISMFSESLVPLHGGGG